ncbi:MAG: hypothetical protein Sylvanvirus21_9 [Sylvanvirus sp.]|uniref:Uncharacterized protein n=1 Tax=Sylvanvirus sp. TaxID=2487774 RepID=A0A3G5AIN2_9VIRU|nr:MAG: hypothetical protein Sylvanvirus21_9 [Sylvanvirus sp.]
MFTDVISLLPHSKIYAMVCDMTHIDEEGILETIQYQDSPADMYKLIKNRLVNDKSYVELCDNYRLYQVHSNVTQFRIRDTSHKNRILYMITCVMFNKADADELEHLLCPEE